MSKSAKSDLPASEVERRRLCERLRQAREYLNLSQDEVASHLGIPRTALTNIESGQRRIDAIELKRLADLYRQPVSHFTGEEEATALPADVTHLARAAVKLSVKDREELSRFAEYLRARSAPKKGRK
ncbi:MAG: helix-turn-helix domain-containing protein [Gammaproteobacteria bacterium]